MGQKTGDLYSDLVIRGNTSCKHAH